MMTRCEKSCMKTGLHSDSGFTVSSCDSLVTLFSDLWKNSFQGVLEKPLTNLTKFREQTSKSMLDSLKQFNAPEN